MIFFVSILINDFGFAQQTVVKNDSTKLYKDIETFSKRSRFTEFMYKMVFKPTKPVLIKGKRNKKPIQKPYSTFEGKTIRHIYVETLNPFGYSIDDTAFVAQKFLAKAANKLHVKSQAFTIRNLLLFKKNQPFDALLVTESERLVRSRDFVEDVSFFVKAASKNSDSVDIYIRVLDVWSLIPVPKVTNATSGTTLKLTDKNFLGLGHEFQNSLSWYPVKSSTAFSTNYSVPNIKNTYIRTTLHYEIDQHKNFNKSIDFDRPFFSPLAKWAAGANFNFQFRNDSIKTNDSLFVPQRFRFNTQDYWAGWAKQLFKGNSDDDRTTNFITAARFLRVRYLEKPTVDLDSLHIFTNENFYLASIGISSRKYVQDKYIFKFGIKEDVPVGKVICLTGGYQDKPFAKRVYLGARASFGQYYSWGYLSSNFEYGHFLHALKVEQGVFKVDINYFTDLFEIGKWKFREFVKSQITLGINRFPSDSLTINDGYGLDGFNSSDLVGTSRILFTLQTQSYAPINFIGFHFGPFLICTLGMLGNAETGFKKSKLYSQIGVGVLIKNENLIISTFQISIAYYPSIPGNGDHIFKLNPFKTTDFGLKDFEIGKPSVVIYQ
ncbi:MAG TPA: hypothetical protein DCG69_03130 [Bacteroidales bacterium]|nr:hypothetical protein [Bacteroidales bacterium]